MPVERIEIVYRARSTSCLYFEGFSSDLQLPTRVTSTAVVRCGQRLYVAPRIPGRELVRVLGLEVHASDLTPPCDWLEEMGSNGVIDAGDLLELRYLSFVDRVTGMPVRCYVVVAKPGVVFEGRIVVEEPCSKLGDVRALVERLRGTLIVGGLRLAGCGFLEPLSLSARIGSETVAIERLPGVLERLCRG